MTSSEIMESTRVLAGQVWERLIQLVLAPLGNPDMIWIALPLVIATLFITLYFGRHKKEELGWNTAFGNTMVFLFVALNLIREMYTRGGSWESIVLNKLYFTLCIGLGGASLLLMFVTYFHLLPKRVAFFLFSAPPINVTVYVAMSIVYANVPPDNITALAGLVFLLFTLIAAKLIKFGVWLAGLEAEEPEEEKEKEVKTIPEKPEEKPKEKKAIRRNRPSADKV